MGNAPDLSNYNPDPTVLSTYMKTEDYTNLSSESKTQLQVMFNDGIITTSEYNQIKQLLNLDQVNSSKMLINVLASNPQLAIDTVTKEDLALWSQVAELAILLVAIGLINNGSNNPNTGNGITHTGAISAFGGGRLAAILAVLSAMDEKVKNWLANMEASLDQIDSALKQSLESAKANYQAAMQEVNKLIKEAKTIKEKADTAFAMEIASAVITIATSTLQIGMAAHSYRLTSPAKAKNDSINLPRKTPELSNTPLKNQPLNNKDSTVDVNLESPQNSGRIRVTDNSNSGNRKNANGTKNDENENNTPEATGNSSKNPAGKPGESGNADELTAAQRQAKKADSESTARLLDGLSQSLGSLTRGITQLIEAFKNKELADKDYDLKVWSAVLEQIIAEMRQAASVDQAQSEKDRQMADFFRQLADQILKIFEELLDLIQKTSSSQAQASQASVRG
ncbi:MAG: hypothetical protein K0S74_121 [Chlamydiales bacterium]|jgi:hypothetical protein|nr:hypothetical protein [Chlamydiales bacterium]